MQDTSGMKTPAPHFGPQKKAQPQEKCNNSSKHTPFSSFSSGRTVHRMTAKKEKWAQEGSEFTTSITRGESSKAIGQNETLNG